MMIKDATPELIGNNVAVGALFGAVSNLDRHFECGLLDLILMVGWIAKDVLILTPAWRNYTVDFFD